jgi:alpha-beta hydrolase superfamily lysophospholipase
MKPNKHITIFSHGFGVGKDDRGLFTDIAADLPGIETVMFDYNEINEADNTMTVCSFTKQVDIFNDVLRRTKESNSGARINVICHSQGSVIVAMADPVGIDKIILTAPPTNLDLTKIVSHFQSRPGSKIDMDGISRLARADGSVTIIPAEYWKERKDIRPIELYNSLSKRTELIIINANQDHILDGVDFDGLDKMIKVVDIDGDHNFKGESRKILIDYIKKVLVLV